MERSSSDKIAAWFDEHDDGEFARRPRMDPFKVIGPDSSTAAILYTTKPRCILILPNEDSAVRYDIGLVGRYGLPHEGDVAWLGEMSRSRNVCFLGDLDSVDLLVFAWLRAHMKVKYSGISDRLLSAVGLSWNDRMTIPLSESEAHALPLLAEVFPDYPAAIGPQCAMLLESGRKLEIEAITTFSRLTMETLASALDTI